MSQASSLPPGPRQSSFRQLVRSARDPVLFMDECLARYGKVYTTRLPGMPPIVNFALPDAAREVFANPGDTMWAGEATSPIEFLVGRFSLIRLDGARHKRERKLMMPAVHGERMASYGAEMRTITDRVISGFCPGQIVSIQDAMQEITLEVILKTVFGVGGDHPIKQLLTQFLHLSMRPEVTILSVLTSGDRLRRFLGQKYAPIVEKASALGGPWGRLPWAEIARCARDLDVALLSEIVQRRQVAAGRSDIMSLLIGAVDEQGKGLSDAELRDEMMTLLVAGHETTAITLAWATGLCLEHPGVRAEMRLEYARTFGQDGAFDATRIQELKYTEAAIKETLRLYPVASAVVRRLKQPLTIAGYSLPEGVLVSPCAYHLHRDEALWPDPLRFDPSRFLTRRPRPGEWFPFGGGTRTCLGMAFSLYEMKVVLATLLHRTELHRVGPLPRLAQRGILLGPESPIRVKVEAIRP